ncbi:amidohydrolase family protein [Streptomyces sp. NBC_01320]|uniref:amidohydrolase family protein n=1 Tax=Streptomyces sp. NBC_01320 TaxID=2903824 RepID=UPI002E1607D5|nr:amidohydrolase family protein [Streptomyces sp. NBC_01320]WSK01091.1 amidohydrolase family protein [Streptomyces sp. NBC_01320]
MNTLLITADRVIAGPADRVTADGAVLVDESTGAVSAVGPAAELDATVDPQVPRLRCPGATVLPSMTDCHVHLAFDSGPDPIGTTAQATPAELSAGMAERARQLLTAGVTTLRDLGDRDALAASLRSAITSGALPGPRILTATAPLTSHGGNCGFLGGEVTTDDDIRARIAHNASLGADVITTMTGTSAPAP